MTTGKLEIDNIMSAICTHTHHLTYLCHTNTPLRSPNNFLFASTYRERGSRLSARGGLYPPGPPNEDRARILEDVSFK